MVHISTEHVIEHIRNAKELYYRLVIIAAPSGSNKTALLHSVQAQTGTFLINVNLELSRLLLNLDSWTRARECQRLLSDRIRSFGAEVILADNIEILFDITLRQDPLRLLKDLSRNQTIVATWNGSVDNGYLTYASPEHPEHRRYPCDDIPVINAT